MYLEHFICRPLVSVPFPLFLLFPQTALFLQLHGPAWTSSPWKNGTTKKWELEYNFPNVLDVYVSTIRLRTSSSCFSVSFISTSFSNLICSQASSKRLRVTIFIFTSRMVFFVAVSKMWFHLLSCWWKHKNVNYPGNVKSVLKLVGTTARSTHVKASEPTFSSSLWSWYSWLVVCSFSRWCWSSSLRRALLCWSTWFCAFFSFSQSCDLRWRRFSRWTMNKGPSLNWRRQTLVTNTSCVRFYVFKVVLFDRNRTCVMWTTPSMSSSYRACFCSTSSRCSFLFTRSVYLFFNLMISASFWNFSFLSFSALAMIWLMCSSCTKQSTASANQKKKSIAHWQKLCHGAHLEEHFEAEAWFFQSINLPIQHCNLILKSV